MSVNQQGSGHARGRGVRAWLVSILLAMGWHALWFVWLQGGEARARTRMPGVPTVRYWPVSVEGASPAVAARKETAFWSTTLFSLPTVAGFSRTVLTNEIGVRPPLAMPPASARFLSRASRAAILSEGEGLGAAPHMQESVAEVLDAFPLRTPAEPVFTRPTSTGLVVRTEWTGSFSGAQLVDGILPGWPPVLRERSWEAVAYLETDEDGRVRHVFLERRSPSDPFNIELVRLMRTWRVEGVSHPASGRMAIRAFMPVLSAAAQEGETP